ncbi:hypothetical protein RRG08_008231 [Elysia crispata]|uniref:Uncharacterized protein n=1 Tax=Elysia crispata TaxID=231223 RepID=A0AAE1CVW9_9GAST|nr:hypothetical protein RRG08_008231 [Elysia crispata]
MSNDQSMRTSSDASRKLSAILISRGHIYGLCSAAAEQEVCASRDAVKSLKHGWLYVSAPIPAQVQATFENSLVKDSRKSPDGSQQQGEGRAAACRTSYLNNALGKPVKTFSYGDCLSYGVYNSEIPDIIPRTKSAAFSLYTRPAENLAISRPAENLAISRPALEAIPSRRWTRLSNREIRTALPAGRLWINPLPLTLSHGVIVSSGNIERRRNTTSPTATKLGLCTMYVHVREMTTLMAAKEEILCVRTKTTNRTHACLRTSFSISLAQVIFTEKRPDFIHVDAGVKNSDENKS